MRMVTRVLACVLNRMMTWKTVRLELARTAAFPRGSASRAYILRLPLSEDGKIEADAVADNPSRATTQRFWSSEPDQFGRIELVDGQWLLRYQGRQGENLVRMPSRPLRLDQEVFIQESDGSQNPFRVASIRNNGAAIAKVS